MPTGRPAHLAGRRPGTHSDAHDASDTADGRL